MDIPDLSTDQLWKKQYLLAKYGSNKMSPSFCGKNTSSVKVDKFAVITWK